MIPHTEAQWQGPDWQQQLREALRTPAELLRFVGLETGEDKHRDIACREFTTLVPRPYAARMRRGDPQDPLLLQVLPRAQENEPAPGFGTDPVGENSRVVQPGIIHKYHGRALLLISSGCAVNCRYCFRRHFDYDDNRPARREWQGSLSWLRQQTDITEIILSGGDPLLAPDSHLEELVDALCEIAHLRRLRIHTRLPVVLPSRVTERLCALLSDTRLQTVVVLHCNHAREIDPAVADSIARLRAAGATLLNQAVLLRGVNDSAAAQADLSESLFDARVLPYYLHLLDPVAGAAHFDVSEEHARSVYADLLASLPGYLVPRLVREVAGAPSKVPLIP